MRSAARGLLLQYDRSEHLQRTVADVMLVTEGMTQEDVYADVREIALDAWEAANPSTTMGTPVVLNYYLAKNE